MCVTSSTKSKSSMSDRSTPAATVAVLGGGPAGASTAIKAAQTLQKQGADPASVVLVEKRGPGGQTHANEKVCGGFVMQDGLDFMRNELGLDLASTPHKPMRQVLLADGGFLENPLYIRSTTAVEEPEWGSTFHRKDLDATLIERAQELGVTVLFGGSARTIDQDEQGMFNIKVQGPGGTEPVIIDTRLLVGAFGANPRLREQFFGLMGANLGEEDDYTGIAYRFIGSEMPAGFGQDDLRVNLLQFKTDGRIASTYAWDWPAPDEGGNYRSNKGLGLCKQGDEKGMQDFDRSRAIRELFPMDAKTLGGVHDGGLFSVRGALLPMYRPGAIPEIVMNGGSVIAIVGDAAGHINPLSGEGITEAMEDGMLGVALAKALIGGDLGSVRRYSLMNNVSPVAINRRLSYGVASELFQNPKHYRSLLDAMLCYPEAGRLMTTFVKRGVLGLKQLDRPTLQALAMVARTDPSIAAALLRVFREAFK